MRIMYSRYAQISIDNNAFRLKILLYIMSLKDIISGY